MLSIQNISPPSLSEDNNQQGMFQGENDSKNSKETVRANSNSFADCEDVTPTQIIPPENAPHENSVNADNIVTDCDDTEVITNKPPQNELIQDDMTTQITNFENKQPFEDKPNKNVVSEDIPTKIRENEGILLNNTHDKKNFDEVVDQFKRVLQSPINVKSEIQNDSNENVITSDKSIDVDCNNATQDNKGQREKSNESLVVSSNTDDKVVQCPVDGNVTNNIKDENEKYMLSIQNNISPPSLSEDNNQQGMFQGANDSKHSKETVRANSNSFADCDDVTPTQIIPPENAPHEYIVNADNIVTDCDETEVITNKPPQNELIQDDMTTQITNFENKQPFENKPNKNVVSEDIPTKIKENEGILLNNTHDKKNFDEVVDQFKRALQSPMNVKSEIQNDPNENVITSDKSIDVDCNNATQDNKGQREKSNDSLVVSSNTDDKVVQCPVDGNVTNNIKDENETKYCGRGLPSQEEMDVQFNKSANVTKLTNVSYSSDEESSPKRSRQFTFSDSDLPNDDEIKEILKMYPKPTFIESFSESESENSSEDEGNRPIFRRRRNKPEPVDLTKMLEILPERVSTRLKKPPVKWGYEDMKKPCAILKPNYLTVQENEIDADIILVNIRRFKAFGKRNSNKDLKKQKSVKAEKKKRSLRKKAVNKSNKHKKNIKVKPIRKNTSKSTSNARKSAVLKIKNTDSPVSTSAAKTITARTRSMKKENYVKNTQNKRILQQNRNKKTNCKQKLTNMKDRSRLVENKIRRSKRQPKAKQKNDSTMKAQISIQKSIHEQSTVYYISPSSSKSPKSLKRSLVDDNDVPSPKKTRFQNRKNNQELNNNNNRVKKTQRGHLTVFHSKELQQDQRGPYLEKYEPEPQVRTRMLNSNRNSLNMKTQSQTRMLNCNRNSLNMKTRSQTRMLSRNRNTLNMQTQSQTRMLSRNRNSLNMKTQTQTRMLKRNRNSLNMKTQSQTRMLSRNRNSLNMKTQSHTRMLSRNRNSLNMKTRTQSARRRYQRACKRTRDGGARR